ncbi:alpha-methylacyl-coa racemase [Fusarium pseudocircinatum]|uniref:Alpha-methylacyl-coa racemase n=1 Tax=Fusarium pseudocircinatum TaxID=56676 RepID=A0A8H5P0B9_9HYPO|nr:alpha-methylacyl-coa racemase [Fusarium pseudocircinatum]
MLTIRRKLVAPLWRSALSRRGNATAATPRLPLTGIRVLDISRVLAGPYCAQILGDLGAEVIKIEHPTRGDDTRAWGPPFAPYKDGRDGEGESAYYLSVNRNKRSVAVSFKEKEGAKLIQTLAAKADIIVENYLPGTLKKYGLDYNTLAKTNPRLIYASITGYGQTGPYSSRAGFDVMVEAEMGLMHITGPRDGPPVKVGVAVTDLTTGLYAVNTFLASVVPYRAFRTKDGDILIGGANDRLFGVLCRCLGQDDWATDERFSTNSARVANRDVLERMIEDITSSKLSKEWLDIFEGTGLAYAKINDIKDTLEHSHGKSHSPSISHMLTMAISCGEGYD